MDPTLQVVQGIRVAVEGCGHGTLNAIYAATERACEARNWPGVDLLIIGGDFQAVRNAYDLTVMSVPEKFREIGDFHEYYSGSRKAPYLTIFVGGNHEASSHLFELYYGGWVAPNIYYMGAANVLQLGPVRIAGMTGIWKGYNYNKPHYERLPYNRDDIKSIYHIRELDVRKLLQIRTQVDIGISHDWPRAIERSGDERNLFRMKPDFEQESKDGTLGNQAAAYVMDRLRPPYWFSAHMHCKFAATRIYEDKKDLEADADEAIALASHTNGNPAGLPYTNGVPAHNDDEIDLDMDEEELDRGTAPITEQLPTLQKTDEISRDGNEREKTTSVAAAVPEEIRAQLPAAFARQTPVKRLPPGQPVPSTIKNKAVRFLALDKCLPGRKFLQLLDVYPFEKRSETHTASEQIPRYRLAYDPEWLAITRVFASSLILGDRTASTHQDLGEDHYRSLIETEQAWVQDNIVSQGKLTVPENFIITAPVHIAGMPESVSQQPEEYNNPQTMVFCDLVGIPNPFFATEAEKATRLAAGPPPEDSRRDSIFSGLRGRREGDRGRFGGRGGRGGRGRGRGRNRW